MTVIPDSIEPVEAWRSWTFDGKHLRSHNGEVWKPGEALAAKCGANSEQRWTLVRGSRTTITEAAERTRATNKAVSDQLSMMWPPSYAPPARFLTAPTVEPPPGYGYALVARHHDAPQPDCSCGIYAASTRDSCPRGHVYGKVKLWGTVIPGERGTRAQYAYPSELHVPPSLADNAGLLAYDAPVVVDDSLHDRGLYNLPAGLYATDPRRVKGHRKAQYALWIAAAMNLGACAFNLARVL